MNGDKDQLIGFFDALDVSLYTIISDHHDLFDEDMHKLYIDVFPDIQEKIHDIKDFIGDKWEDINEELDDLGLTGDHLKYKIRGFYKSKEQWGFRRIARLILRVLKWADIILGSICNIVPGGEIVKEFKEAVEESIEELDE